MKERRRRGGDRNRAHERQSRGGERAQYGRDEPWREEYRQRFPDEPYGGERQRPSFVGGQHHRNFGYPGEGFRGDYQGEDQHPDYREDFGPEGRDEYRASRDRRGGGYGYGFSDGGSYRPAPQPSRQSEHRGDDDQGRGAEGGRERRGMEHRGRSIGGGFGSEYGAWRAGAGRGYGRGPDVSRRRGSESAYGSGYGQGDLDTDRPGRGDWEDSDWTANRPARGRSSWAGDWSTGRRGGELEYETASGRFGGSYGSDLGTDRPRQDFRGRAPKDYRRSDDRIREEVSDRFTDDPYLDPSDVTIKVENGDVTLLGTVADRDQKRRAEEVAEQCSGVAEVINQLRVARGETTSQG